MKRNHAEVWRLAVPIMLTNITVPLLGLADTAIAGHLPGAEYLGGVAVGAVVFNFLYAGLNFLRMGTTGLTAQAIGANNPDQARSWLARGLFAAMALGLIMAALRTPIIWAALEIAGPGGAVRHMAESYIEIRLWGAPAALMNFVFLGWFFGVHDTRAALITQVYMNGVNIALGVLFVVFWEWGVPGLALATLVSEITAVGLCAWIAREKLAGIGGVWRWDRIKDPTALKRMMAVNADIFIRSICLQIAFVFFTGFGARLGDAPLAANAVLLQFQTFMAYALDGFATAAEVLAGAALGAGNRLEFRRSCETAAIWGVIFSLVFCLVYFAGGEWLINQITTVESVRLEAYQYLPWNYVLPLLSVWSFLLDGIFIGATRTAAMRNGMIISLVLFVMAAHALTPAHGNHGLWAAFCLFMIMRGVTLGAVYPRLEKSVSANSVSGIT